MNKALKARAKQIQEILDHLYASPAIPLRHHSNYTLLIAVLLSAQCTDLRVNSITPKLFALADTPEKMVLIHVEQIEEIIRPCGLANRKAAAIRDLSKILIDKHDGRVPCNFEDLEALPGVGHKTASVIMVQAFNLPAFPVDTHIHRCAQRWGLSNGKNVMQTEKDLKAIFPQESWARLHLQMIYFAREYCKAVKHDPMKCPICSLL